MTRDVDDQVRQLVDRLAEQVDPSGVLPQLRRRLERRRVVARVQTAVVCVVLVAVICLGGYGLLRAVQDRETTAGRPERTIASLALSQQLRVMLTVTRSAGDAARPSSTVTIEVYERQGGAWRLLGQSPVGPSGRWRWDALAGPDAVCELSVEREAATDPRTTALRLHVDLAGHPSTGCSGRYDFRLRDGRLEPA
jgi:hypothetical protein